MPSRIAWSASAEVSTGLAIQGGQSVEVDAIDQVFQTIPAKPEGNDAVPVELVIQPSSDAADLRFFAITANRYGPEIEVTVDGGVAEIPLESPIFLMGGAVAKLLGAAPETLTVVNGNEQSALQITVLVGRLT